ncbi:hypothetical protein [Pseudoalteromonas piscicida]|uniref:hypothetical protein n=1 Tax=Pseudoalteromonas piscicida TaxID=43662 RepID=UPI0030A7C390
MLSDLLKITQGALNRYRFLMLILITLPLFFALEPVALILCLLFLCFLSLKNATVAVFNLYLSIVLSLFFWLYLALVSFAGIYVSESYWPLVKAFLVLPVFFSILKLMNFKFNFKVTGIKTLAMFLIIILFSLAKGLVIDPFVSIAYLGNVYAPIVLQFFLIAMVTKLALDNSHLRKHDYQSSKAFTILICLILVANSTFLIFDLLGVVQLKDIFLSVGESLGRGGSEGNTRTHLFGVLFQRFPGLFADPILAAYTLFLFFTYAFCFVSNMHIKMFLLLLSFFLGFVTLSKAFFFLLICFFSFYFVCKLKVRLKVKFSLALIVLFFSVALIVIRALFTVVTDSSAVHVQGLILPFVSPSSIFAFFIGNDLATGGNMGGWTLQGAESFVGLLMYNTGLFGVLLFFWGFFKLMYKLLESKANSSYFLFCFYMSIVSASFLQENSFNLGFSLVRIALLVFIILFFTRLKGGYEKA